MNKILFLILFIVSLSYSADAQSGLLRRLPGGGGGGGMSGGSKGGDSLVHRDPSEDSITITYRTLDTSRYARTDSSFNDFYQRFPIPSNYFYLGNTGNAAKSLLFSPNKIAGWDPGFHAFDLYDFALADTKFYNTTKPFSELGYLLGPKQEQMIHVKHTQNISPDWNIAFEYRLIASPGFFKNQNTNHNNIRLNTSYQSKNRRYHAFFILLNNKIQSAENGGIVDTMNYIDDVATYSNRLGIPVQLGNKGGSSSSVFSSTINTGTKYKNFTFFLRHQYDLGRKDSVVTDSSVIPLFYPKVRAEHNFKYTSYMYSFVDNAAAGANPSDSFYRHHYNFVTTGNGVLKMDKWKEIFNDFSIYQFPDEKNSQQFFKVGASLQNLFGQFQTASNSLYNIMGHGEYRNKTRNQKWDIEANGELYFAGYNAGNYNALISLKRFISKQLGYLQAGFQNINRSPSFIYEPGSSFNLSQSSNFVNENITNIFATIDQPIRDLRLSGNYYLITNYTYFTDFYKADQSAAVFNLLQVSADKRFRLTKHWNLYSNLTVQQKAGSAPVNVPLVYTSQRITYEGSLGFKNLMMIVGAEVLYNTPYKADGYSPVTGQFFYQDQETISLKRPKINGFLHFRIKRFTAYVRAENLNTVRLKPAFGFTNNNFAIANYPYPGLVFRLGIFWTFLN
ncbi:MAG: putative porin [Chitinophagaceae bacterium]